MQLSVKVLLYKFTKRQGAKKRDMKRCKTETNGETDLRLIKD